MVDASIFYEIVDGIERLFVIDSNIGVKFVLVLVDDADDHWDKGTLIPRNILDEQLIFAGFWFHKAEAEG
jgi:hypothetical protein